MKNFYKTLFAIAVLMGLSTWALAQEEAPARKPPSVAYEGITVSVAALNSSSFATYKKEASTIPGVTVLGFCSSEKLILVMVDRMKFVPTAQPDAKATNTANISSPELMPYEDFASRVIRELNLKTNTYGEYSIKMVSEVQKKCPDLIQ